MTRRNVTEQIIFDYDVSDDEYQSGDLDELDLILDNNFYTTFNHLLSTESGSASVL